MRAKHAQLFRLLGIFGVVCRRSRPRVLADFCRLVNVRGGDTAPARHVVTRRSLDARCLNLATPHSQKTVPDDVQGSQRTINRL